MFPDMSELLFSILISYLGALEFIFVMKHLYHWVFKHQKQLLSGGPEGESLEDLQNRIKNAIEEAKTKEFGEFKAMKDGVLYKDGFRVDPDNIAVQEQPRHKIIASSENRLEHYPDEVHEESCVKKVIQKSATPARTELQVHPSEIVENQRTSLPYNNKEQLLQSNSLQKQAGSPEDPLSNEPITSQEPSSLSTQQSSYMETVPMSGIHFNEYERQAPDAEDVIDAKQYSDDYLRSLDGIKLRPLVRDDGTRRRRAFKKRRSSGDSTSSRESRTSREEELKMFTSLEEEEFAAMKRGDSDYTPIRYSSDPNLKVAKHHKRHKRSPVKDINHTIDINESKSSLEMLDEEENNPWGEIKPEHYKNTEFWKREKAISIDEEDIEDPVNSWRKKNNQFATIREDLHPDSPTRNASKSSSFEEATDIQHEDAFNTLKPHSSIDMEHKTSERQEHQNVSMDDDNYNDVHLKSLAGNSNASCGEPNSNNACEPSKYHIGLEDQQNDLTGNEDYRNEQSSIANTAPALRHSKKAFRDLSLQDDSEEEDAVLNAEQEESPVDEDDYDCNQTPPSYVDEFDRSVTSTGFEVRSFSLPEITVKTAEPPTLEGLSDFYDFNASINPSRSPSVDRSKSKTPRPVSRLAFHHRSNKSHTIESFKFKNAKDIEGLSDFFDHNVKINQSAYGNTNKRERDAHRTSVDYIVENLSTDQSKAMAKKNDKNASLDIKIVRHSPIIQSPTTPSSPECRRSFSTEQRHIDHLREKYQNKSFKRSTYIGESMDFDDDFEELREQTRHFQRSRSKSRSLDEEELLPSNAEASTSTSRRALQDQILAEITKTTINYQEFSRDMNQNFIDHERRGSDSALIAKPKILIQIDSERRNYDFDSDDILNELEAEEYHHLRRFSLHQEYQVEEYPSDNEYDYIEQFQVRSRDGTESWTEEDFFSRNNDTKTASIDETSPVSLETLDDSDHDGEGEDTGSEDERLTIVEVDDSINDDIWDCDRQDDENNDQSDTDDIQEVKTYENGNLNEGDWKEEGAVGGAIHENREDHENSLKIEEIYDDAVKNLEEAGIERDYENIFESVVAKPGEYDERGSIKPDDLLDEILNEDDKKYHRRSKESTSLLEHERVSSSSSTSTRLRSRYEIDTSSLSYSSYEIDESATGSDTIYTPKKEYNWRKNFRLDDDNNGDEFSTGNPSNYDPNLSLSMDETQNDEEEHHQDFLDKRKYSLGGDSITLYSRTPDRFQDFPSDEEKIATSCDIPDEESFNKPLVEQIEATNIEPETGTKKKKKKKGTRKSSQASIEDTYDVDARRISVTDRRTSLDDDESQKKITKTKKKKSKDHSNEEKVVDSKENSPGSPSFKAAESKSPIEVRSSAHSVQKIGVPDSSELKSERNRGNTTVPSFLDQKTPEISRPLFNVRNESVLQPAPEIQTVPSKSSTPVSQTRTDSANKPVGSSSIGTTNPQARPPLERRESSGVYELIKDGSMYPWF